MVFEFLASLSNVIRLSLAFATEVLLTFLATDSKLAHMNSSLRRNRLTNVVFDFVINLSLDDFHNILATACD
jgi:hypothetical protein